MPSFQHLLLCALSVAACGTVNEPADPAPDAPIAVCTAESDAAFCERTGTTCGEVTAADNCGDSRKVDCGACPAVCGDLNFPQTGLIAAANAPGVQDAVVGVSSTGTSVLTQRRSVCGGPFTLVLTDGLGTAPTTTDLSSLAALADVALDAEAAVTLSADGLAIIGRRRGGTAILVSTRPAINSTAFSVATGGDFTAIAPPVNGVLNAPVLSNDGLAFYYQVHSAGSGVDGIYESVRSSKSVPFPAGTRMPEVVQQASYPTGISADRRTLFLTTPGFGTIVLTRGSVGQPFANPNAPSPPPSIAGFRVRPVADCQSLIGTCTGGCTGEDTCRFTH